MAPALVHRYCMVVALDLSEYSEVVLEHALDLAARHDACELHLLVVHERTASLDDEKRLLAELARDKLAAFGATEHDWRLHLHVRTGDSADQIAALAAEARADVIVMGRFGRHGARRGLGGVTNRVLAQAPCATLVVQLRDQGVETVAQCPRCVVVRRDSDGERWFCDDHLAPDRAVSLRIPMAVDLTGGTLLW